MFNKYSVYGYIAQESKELADGKFMNTVKCLENITNYSDAYNMISSLAGYRIEGKKKLNGPNNLNIGVIKDSEKLEIVAWVKGEQIFGRGWHIPKENSE